MHAKSVCVCVCILSNAILFFLHIVQTKSEREKDQESDEEEGGMGAQRICYSNNKINERVDSIQSQFAD